MGHWLHGMARRTEEIELNQAAAAPKFVATTSPGCSAPGELRDPRRTNQSFPGSSFSRLKEFATEDERTGALARISGGGTYKGDITSPTEVQTSWEGTYQLG